MSSLRPRRFPLILALAVLGVVARGAAQGRPGGGGPGGMPGRGGMGAMGEGINRPFPHSTGPNNGNPRNSPPPGGTPNGGGPTESTMGGGLQLGPPGRWWDDSGFARSLNIDSRQQHRMDDVFSANRGTLLKLYKNLHEEEKQLAKTIRSKDLDENAIFAQIDRVTEARGELEKANAHYLLQLRKEMTPEQTAKLDEHRPSPPE